MNNSIFDHGKFMGPLLCFLSYTSINSQRGHREITSRYGHTSSVVKNMATEIQCFQVQGYIAYGILQPGGRDIMDRETLGPVAKSQCTAWLGGPWVASRRSRARDIAAKSWNEVYSMRRYPFMNNNGCQIYFILLLNLLVWIEIYSKVGNTRHALPFWHIVFIRLLYGSAG